MGTRIEPLMKLLLEDKSSDVKRQIRNKALNSLELLGLDLRAESFLIKKATEDGLIEGQFRDMANGAAVRLLGSLGDYVVLMTVLDTLKNGADVSLEKQRPKSLRRSCPNCKSKIDFILCQRCQKLACPNCSINDGHIFQHKLCFQRSLKLGRI